MMAGAAVDVEVHPAVLPQTLLGDECAENESTGTRGDSTSDGVQW